MAARQPIAKKTAAKTASQSGAVESHFAQQPPDKRTLLTMLRALVEKGAPDAVPSIKWGVPIYAQNGRNICALAAFKDHVGLNFFAPPSALADPKKKLEGGGKDEPHAESSERRRYRCAEHQSLDEGGGCRQQLNCATCG